MRLIGNSFDDKKKRENMFIDGIGLSGFRSFGDDIQLIAPFSKINLFIGQNNSGKSNILLFLSKHYKDGVRGILEGGRMNFDKDLDFPLGRVPEVFRIAIPIISRQRFLERINKKQNILQRDSDYLNRILTSNTLTYKSDFTWITFEAKWDGAFGLDLSSNVLSDLLDQKVLSENEWRQVWRDLINKNGGDVKAHWIPETIRWVSHNLEINSIKIDMIPAIRRIANESGNKRDDFSGLGIIDRLAKLQNPDHDKQILKEDFDKINEFLQEVTESKTAKLEIPYKRDKIIVHMDGKTLPLDSLGTGIHEVIILASAATVLKDQVVCVEEPELHLHPLLQKKLLQYLHDKTNNQYFITTHSAHLLDLENISIFHVSLQNGESIVKPVITDSQKFFICKDLGYRASDILQSNCIIWVEGPSDRIYINHWINNFDSSLIEGVHYSIMFYGGRLLNHLSVDDPEVEDFISLRKLNRNICLVMDSDKKNSRSRINDTKKRIVKEFEKNPGFVWITKGREIENYFDPVLIEKIVKKIHPNAICKSNLGEFDNCLKEFVDSKKQSEINVDKVKVAREVVKNEINFDILDLKKQISNLIKFIRESNGQTS